MSGKKQRPMVKKKSLVRSLRQMGWTINAIHRYMVRHKNQISRKTVMRWVREIDNPNYTVVFPKDNYYKCANPNCDTMLLRTKTQGRPAIYCDVCQVIFRDKQYQEREILWTTGKQWVYVSKEHKANQVKCYKHRDKS